MTPSANQSRPSRLTPRAKALSAGIRLQVFPWSRLRARPPVWVFTKMDPSGYRMIPSIPRTSRVPWGTILTVSPILTWTRSQPAAWIGSSNYATLTTHNSSRLIAHPLPGSPPSLLPPRLQEYKGESYQPVAKVVAAFDRPCIPADCVVISHILPVCSRIAPCPAGAGTVSVLARLSPRTVTH